jgi:hypothetical protein
MPQQPVECADLAAAVIARPCPLLFLDTAAILDILRVPFRHELQVKILDSAVTTVDDALADPKLVWAVTTANVIQEFEANRESIKKELGAHISKLNQSVARVSSVAKILFPERRIGSLEWQELKLEERLLSIMDRLVDSLVLFRGTMACVSNARNRLWAGLHPASKAKYEFKDCEIFEEFLELVGLLRGQGFAETAVFVTSNGNDYGRPPNGHPQKALDLAACEARYAADLSWARAFMRASAI